MGRGGVHPPGEGAGLNKLDTDVTPVRIALGSVVASAISPEGHVPWMCDQLMSVAQILRQHSRLLRMERDGAKECWAPGSTSIAECLSRAAVLTQRAQWRLGGSLNGDEAGVSR